MLSNLLLTFFASFTFLFIFRIIGIRYSLIDKPNFRKNHQGHIPLVGGVALYGTLLIYFLVSSDAINSSTLFLISISTLIVIGVIDDKFDISYKSRLLTQVILSLLMINYADLSLHYLGNILGSSFIDLGFIAPLITIFAVIGLINAMNMVDGIDGLLGGLSFTAFASLSLLLYMKDHEQAQLCMIICVALIPYLLMNLGLLGRQHKIFMGDAGSMMIGFSLIWILISVSQKQQVIRPITAIWFIAIPLIDMTALIIYRLQKKRSPFKPDREHLHHVLQRLGFTNTQALITILFFSVLFCAFGILGEIYNIAESIMFFSFIFCFISYFLWLQHYRHIKTLSHMSKIEKSIV
tara:strand:+ start:217 stop:1269 length:1053 start_codon:yes stop_codon:yes gene_type:complete